MNVIVSSRGTRLLESFSKLVERREAVKLYLAHELAKFFAVESRILACALEPRERTRALETRVPVHAVAGD